jgi:hypothetical protein
MLNTKSIEKLKKSESDSSKNYLKFIIILPCLCTRTAEKGFTGEGC